MWSRSSTGSQTTMSRSDRWNAWTVPAWGQIPWLPARHKQAAIGPGTESAAVEEPGGPSQGSLPARAASPLAGRDSHPLDDKRGFMEPSRRSDSLRPAGPGRTETPVRIVRRGELAGRVIERDVWGSVWPPSPTRNAEAFDCSARSSPSPTPSCGEHTRSTTGSRAGSSA